MRAMIVASLMPVLLAASLAAQPAQKRSGIFWEALDKLGFVFKSMGNLGAGVERGSVWIVDLDSGERRRVVQSDDLAWPVAAPDSAAIFALRGRQVIRIAAGKQDAAGPEADWRKLLGVTPDGSVLGFVEARPRAQPAILTPDGSLVVFPQPDSAEERRDASILLQEEREDRDGRQLKVWRSERGGRGFDVFLVTSQGSRNLTDCGDDACGQPSFSPDKRFVLYVRAPA